MSLAIAGVFLLNTSVYSIDISHLRPPSQFSNSTKEFIENNLNKKSSTILDVKNHGKLKKSELLAIIWDFDNTIGETPETWRESMAKYFASILYPDGYEESVLQDLREDYIDGSAGRPVTEQIEWVKKQVEKQGRAAKSLEEYKKGWENFRNPMREKIYLIEGVTELLETFHKEGLPQFIVSGGDIKTKLAAYEKFNLKAYDINSEDLYADGDERFPEGFAKEKAFKEIDAKIRKLYAINDKTIPIIATIGDGPSEMEAGQNINAITIGFNQEHKADIVIKGESYKDPKAIIKLILNRKSDKINRLSNYKQTKKMLTREEITTLVNKLKKNNTLLIKNNGLIEQASFKWTYSNSNLNRVNQRLGIDILETIISKAEEAKKISPDKIVTVVDWGCGNGRALNDIAEQLEIRKIDNIKLIGFGNGLFPEWKNVNKKVSFIFDDSDNFFKYFSEGQIDFIYSHFGLIHIKPDGKFIKYIDKIKPYLNNNGEIICCSLNFEDVYSALEEMGFEVSKIKSKENDTHAMLLSLKEAQNGM